MQGETGKKWSVRIRTRENQVLESRIAESYLLFRFEMLKAYFSVGLSISAFLGSLSPHCPFCQVLLIFPLGDGLGTLSLWLQATALSCLCLKEKHQSHSPHSPVSSTLVSLVQHKYDAICRDRYYSQWCLPTIVVFPDQLGKPHCVH